MQHHGGQHPGDAEVDSEMRSTENLRYRVDAQPPITPDQPEVGGVLRLDPVGNRELLGPRRQLGEGCLPAVRVTQDAVLDLDLGGGHLPRFRRRGHKSCPCLRSGQPVPHPIPLHRIGRAGELEAAAGGGVSVHVAVRPVSIRRVDNADGIEISVEFLGDERRQASVDSLSHLDLARVRHDRPVLTDADVRMDGVARLFGRQAVDLRLSGRDEWIGMITARERVGGLANRGPDARIRTAAAQVPAHPLVDLRVVRGGV
jgi:hypothetical protein